MLGCAPVALPSDAYMLRIDPVAQRAPHSPVGSVSLPPFSGVCLDIDFDHDVLGQSLKKLA